MRRWWTVGLCALSVGAAMSATALAEWQAVQWGDPNLPYDAFGDTKEVIIRGTGAYKFYFVDDGTGELEDVWQLYIPPELRGAVTVHVAKPNSAPGARDVGLLYLLPAEPGTLAELRITRDLGVGEFVDVDAITGVVDVGRDIVTSVRVRGDCDGPVSVGGDVAGIQVDGDVGSAVSILGETGYFVSDGKLEADLWFGHAVDVLDIAGRIDADIDVAYEGVVTMRLGEVDDAVSIAVNGNVTQLFADGPFAGRLDVFDNVDSASFSDDVSGTVYMRTVATLTISGSEMSGQLLTDSLSGIDADGLAFDGTTWSGSLAALVADADITIGSGADFAGSIWIGDANARVVLYGAADGKISCDRLVGSVEVHADGQTPAQLQGVWNVGVVDGGSVTVGGPSEPQAVVRGVIETSDFTAGSIKVFGLLDDPNSDGAGGHIIVDGAFGTNDPNVPATIDVKDGFKADTEFVTIDFYARLAPTVEDRWLDSGVVSIDGDEYYGNAPQDHVYLVSRCKGDADGDADVDYYDIDPLLDAFGDGAAYNAAFPGLSASRLFHCDLDCSGTVDFYDIDPFIARLGTCTPECYEYDSMQGGGEGQQMQMMGGAAVLAAQLAASVSAENMPALIAAIEQLALNPPPNSTTDWSAVLAALAGM